MKKGKYHAGMLRDRVTIQRNDIVSDGAGGFSDNWVNIAVDLPAGLSPRASRRTFMADSWRRPRGYVS